MAVSAKGGLILNLFNFTFWTVIFIFVRQLADLILNFFILGAACGADCCK